MAFCSNCNAPIGQMDVACSVCGFDFPDDSPNVPRSGFAYSPLADISLIVGSIFAGIGCIGAIIFGIVAVVYGAYWQAFFFAPISFCLSFALLVVYTRIQNA